jgi:2-polyprenyl-3-methyl-5-hydroxy-6-metoxy-1,4-benzoquinol methylase
MYSEIRNSSGMHLHTLSKDLEGCFMESSEKVYDYLARLQIEGCGKTWLGNRRKILYVFRRAMKYLKPGMHVCEIGIGEGYLLLLLRSSRLDLKITGVDISEYLIRRLAFLKGLGINLLKHDISKPITGDMLQSFDIIFALDVLEHIEALEKAIENINRLLKPGGVLIATVPWKENLADNMVMCPVCYHVFHRWGHYHSFHSLSDVAKMLGKSFKVIEYDFVFLSFEALLKRTIFRKKFYRDGLPNFQATLFFVAQKI